MVKKGDIVKINFDPAEGYEQSGYRPAIVVSNDLFNTMCSLTIVCPITNTDKNHPFHVRLDKKTQTTGVVLCDQVRVLDLKARNAKFIESVPEDITNEVSDIIKGFV
jgi:mRNA interferase MazF